MSYLAIKHIHTTAAALSLAFFVLRAAWSVAGAAQLHYRFVRIAPHVIDTILLVAGVAMAIMIGPFQTWIMAKIIGLLVYISVGTIAIKRGKTRTTRAIAALIAVLVFAYIVGVAVTKQAFFFIN